MGTIKFETSGIKCTPWSNKPIWCLYFGRLGLIPFHACWNIYEHFTRTWFKCWCGKYRSKLLNTVKYPIRAYFLCMYGKSANYHSIFNLQNKRIDMRNVWGQSVGDLIISADPGLRQGRGGAWDHRRCGACFCWLATTLPSTNSDKAPRAQSQHVTATLHASNATTLARPQTLKMPKTLRGSLDQALKPLPSVVQGV